ncbi:MAG: hypothetical protein J2P49_05450 [Methylocapsa sp.]|nr:hypothetical protein [Methylocapsa sp.]
MGAVEHLKSLCCLGLKPESAMVAAAPLLHDIIPHGWSRFALLAPDATITSAYAENPAMDAVFRERMWRFMNDPASPASLWLPAFRATSIGWSLHRQGRGYLESGYYREVEAPLDSCWLLTAMVGDGERTIGAVHLTRPRTARPFTVEDVQRLDRLRPWLGFALRPSCTGPREEPDVPLWTAGPPLLAGQAILSCEGKTVFQTVNVEQLFRIINAEPANFTHYVPARGGLPAPVLALVQRILGAASGSLVDPPRMQISTAHGTVTLEAKWLVPKDTAAADAAKNPKSCLIAVAIELHEHALAYAARVLRENGATPAQLKIGVLLALGKTKPEIAGALGLKLTSVADLTRKLYQSFEVHNVAELGTKIWLGEGYRSAQLPELPVLGSRAMAQANFCSPFGSSI